MKKNSDDKTAGTDARMQPGEEGRGGVRRQRRPEVQSEPKGELQKLIDQAIQVADHLGHKDCIVWQVNEDANAGQIRCPMCEKLAGFAIAPRQIKTRDPNRKGKVIFLPGEKISGQVVTERCEG
jgi:hypothetical protein